MIGRSTPAAGVSSKKRTPRCTQNLHRIVSSSERRRANEIDSVIPAPIPTLGRCRRARPSPSAFSRSSSKAPRNGSKAKCTWCRAPPGATATARNAGIEKFRFYALDICRTRPIIIYALSIPVPTHPMYCEPSTHVLRPEHSCLRAEQHAFRACRFLRIPCFAATIPCFPAEQGIDA
jgi:hypothetical protein